MSKKSSLPAVILAAGRGSRLGELTEDIPKALLEVAGRTLLQRQLEVLRSLKIAPVYILTGFAREKFEVYLSDDVIEIFNERWISANNLVTLATAGEILDNGFLLLNADVLFQPLILERLLANPAPNVLVVDREKKLGEEEMKVSLDGDGKITDISKTIPQQRADGEYIGIARFDAMGAKSLRSAMSEIIAEGRTDEWYEAAIAAMSSRTTIKTCPTGGLPWIEIDTPADFTAARKMADEHGWGTEA